MTETKDPTDKTLRPGGTGAAGGAGAAAGSGGRKPLSLQRTVESGHVRQNFSHGRSKSVVVEKRKTRKLGSGTEVEAPVAPTPAPAARPVAASSPPPAAPRSTQGSGGDRQPTLRPEERDARSRALAEARRQAEISEVQRTEQDQLDAEHRAANPQSADVAPEAPAVITAPQPVATAADREPSAVPAATAAAPRRADDRPSSPGSKAPGQFSRPRPQQGGYNTAFMPREGGRPKEISIPSRGAPPPDRNAGGVEPPKGKDIRGEPRRVAKPVEATDEEETRVIKRGGKLVRTPVKTTPEPPKERVKLTINNAFDDQQRERSLASLKRKRERERLKAMGVQQPRDKIVREVIIPEAITIQELSNRMTERAVDLIKILMKEGAMHKITDVIDADTAELLVQEFGHTAKRVSEADVETGFIGDKDETENLKSRAPVVTIMGHVDHGKTSLLDAIRQTNVVSGEAGGITQHIGAYQVRLPKGERITFLDTPGHAAFSAMRSRGAQVTDIVVLVVSADDGVMPQTIEAISHAKAAGAPIIVAINKIDKPGANAAKIQQDLLNYDLQTEAYGGDVQAVEVSATKKIGLEKLVEAITLQAELMELKANPKRSAEAGVIEAKLDKGRGPVATALISRGTLRRGDIVVVGSVWGRVRALMNERNQQVTEAGPSEPVEVLGLESVPEPGDSLFVVENEARAREVSDYRGRVKREQSIVPTSARASLEQMMSRLKADEIRDLPLILKADVQGSVEAITHALGRLSQEEVRARVIMGAVGGITESDVDLAKSSGAPLIAFNVRANAQARDMATREGVEIRYYSIIYNLLDDIRDTLSGMLKPELREKFLGYAQILEVFNITKVGKVAGCRISEGVIKRGCGVRLLRDNVVIHEGKLGTLKRFKDEVPEVTSGQECGMGFEKYEDIRVGDQIECFEVEVIKRSLENKA